MSITNLGDFLKYASSITPTQRQQSWYETGFYAFIHFSPNTYTDLEWGTGKEDPSIFNPVCLNCDQWVAAAKSAGMKGLILTAKHHDGFCLWQTKTTAHSMKSSPYRDGRGDVVREAAEACRRGGIKFGFYLSPWDRNSPLYGSPAYNDFYKEQLTELLTQYGEIFEVWFDGACGEGPGGKKQEYDFEGYIDLIRKYQPGAVIFNDFGPDVRWCGNEEGRPRHAEWAVVPYELCYRHQTKPDIDGLPMLEGGLDYMYNTDENIGELDAILYSRKLVFCGAEIDMSIRPGWFYHKNEQPHSLDRLFTAYLNSVGANACLNLNIPPMQNGMLDERDIKRLRELGNLIQSSFSVNLAAGADLTVKPQNADGSRLCAELSFKQPQTIKYIVLAEDLTKGQRVSGFAVQFKDDSGSWRTHYSGSCIGNKKICRLPGDGSRGDCLRILITAARGEVFLKDIEVY